MLPPPQSALEVCFRNPIFVQSLFEHISDDPIEQFELRLVNKKFNTEYLHWTRKSHKKITLSFITESDQVTHRFHVNNHTVCYTKARDYYKFLVDVAGVQVRELIVERFNLMADPHAGFRVHDDIMEVLVNNQKLNVMVGMEDLCQFGCPECIKHANECTLYGPLQYWIMYNSFMEPHHFEKLIASEYFLNAIAESSSKDAASKSICMANVKSFISRSVTCDCLCLTIPQSALSDDEMKQPLPMEIIDDMCSAWKVKSIEVKFAERVLPLIRWPLDENFTEMHFIQPFDRTRKSEMRFERVEIYAGDASKIFKTIVAEDENLAEKHNHLMANVRRVFPSQNYSLQNINQGHFNVHKAFDEESLQDILKSSWNGDLQRNWTLKIEYVVSISSFVIDFEVPTVITFMDRPCTVTLLPSTGHTVHKQNCSSKRVFVDFIVRTFQITDEATNNVINLEVSVNKTQLDLAWKERRKEVESGYLKHFLPVELFNNSSAASP